MRKFYSFLFLLFFAILASAQFPITVFGTVTYVNGNPAPDVTVQIEIPSTNPAGGFSYFNELKTDANGFYADSIFLQSNISQGVVNVTMFDCNGTAQTMTGTWGPNNLNIELNFTYCNNSGGNCGVTIELDSTATGNMGLTAFATGNPPFSYLWNTGETTQSILVSPNLVGYCVTITDAAGCTATDCFQFGGGGNCEVKIEEKILNGVLTLNAQAFGSLPYAYEWSNGETTQSIIVAPNVAGYCVTITDGTGCEASDCHQFGGNPNCDLTIVVDSLFGTTGVLLTAVSMSTNAFMLYQWNTGELTPSIMVFQSGEYCVTVTNSVGCTAKDCVTITLGNGNDCKVSIETVQNGGWLNANAWGIPPLSYEWNTGDSTGFIQIDPNLTKYCVTITDGAGCVAEDCIDLMNECTVKIGPNPAIANLYAHPSGVPPFTYEWNTGESTQSINPPEPGEYCVTMTDAVGCKSKDCVFWGMNNCSVTIEVDSVISSIGLKLTAVAEGTPPFKYEWNINTQPNGETIFVGVSGTYCVVITDANGCVATDCVTVTIGSNGCDVHIIEIMTGTNVTALFAATNSVTPNYSYLWNTGEMTSTIYPTQPGNYCVTITTPNGCTDFDCYQYVVSGPNNKIGGFIQLADSLTIPTGMFGDVVLFAMDPATGAPEQVDKTNIIAMPFGYRYEFGWVAPGAYIVRVELAQDSPGFDDFLPTYYGDVVHWNEATLINVPFNANISYDITLVEAGLLNGIGTINGFVYEGDGFAGNGNPDSGGDPMEGISILLFDEMELPASHSLTDESGKFTFENLSWGTYKVEIEIVGKEQVHYWVTLGPNDPTVTGLFFEVNENEISTGLGEILIGESIEIYPNPVSNVLTITFEPKGNPDGRITLTDLTGKLVNIENQTLMTSDHEIHIDMNYLPEGLYFLNFINGKQVISRKIVKQ